MKHKHTLILLLFIFSFVGFNYTQAQISVQSQISSKKRNCATMENLEWLKQQDPDLEARMAEEEQKFNDYIASHQDQTENSKAVYVIPCVVHIVYNGAGEDISDARVMEQITQTNLDWAGTNGRSMESFSSSLRADCQISLCLATIDPIGNPTTGITRTTTTVSSFTTDDNVKSSSTGGVNAWDWTKYFNIWVCDLGTSLCGYAQFPTSGINSTYGVVVNYRYFGLTGATAPFDGGGTLSHEGGHCFNLYHIWGDDNGACTGTDNCADTPNQANSTSGNNSGVLTDACTSTSPGIMYMNFMDYSDDIDYANMTPNQKTRMQSAISSYLTSVANNSVIACAAAQPPVADFTASPTVSCTGIIQFSDISTNTPTSWSWSFGDGGTSTTQNPSHTYSASGTYTVSLTATNAEGSDTEIKTGYITVNLPAAPTTTGATICSGETATLYASGTGTLNWYDAPTGGNLVFTGTAYTTPALTSTTTYYVESTTASAAQYVGNTESNTNGAMFTNANVHYLQFDVMSDLTIVSVEVNAGAAGNRTISLLDNTGATITSTTVNIPAGVSRISLDFNVPVGNNYRLAGPTSPNLWRNNAGCSYPYEIANLIKIDSSSATGSETSYYYYFYDWEVQEAGCTSSRTPVVVTVGGSESVSIEANPTGPTCNGTSVTFNATPVNGGTSPSYQWQLNGSDITGATNSTYISSAFSDGDQVSCEMVSNSSCASGSPVSSNTITMSISVTSIASVNITADPSETICAGGNVIFTATPTNGGSAPAYQWQLNGSDISGETNSTFSSSTLSASDEITCVMTSDASCVSGSPASSNTITMILPTAPVTTNDTICGSGSATLLASGSATLNWYDAPTGGSLVGTGASYTTPTLSTTTTYYVESSTSSSSQYVGPADNTIGTGGYYTGSTFRYQIFDVTSDLRLVSVIIYANGAGNRTIRLQNSGGTDMYTITANLVNGSNVLTLNWDIPVGTNYRLGADATTANNLYRNSAGASYPYSIPGLISITGNNFSTTSYYYFYNWEVQEPGCSSTRSAAIAVVGTGPTATVNITSNPNGSICSGTSVTFTATASNGGTTPTYQWKKGGTNISGATNSTYTSSTLANGDVITCEMTSNESCVSGSPATSNSISLTVSPGGPASVSIAQNPIGSICSGTSVTFTANPTNGGTPSYQWQLNGSNITGGTNSTYTSTVLANGDAVTCIMTSSLSCATGSPATSNSLTMTVYPSVAVGITIAASPNGGICSGTNVTFTATPSNGGTLPSYQWRKNGANISGATNTTYSSSALANGDVITCVLNSSVTCASGNPATSNSITMSVSTSQPASVSITANPSGSICNGTSVTFTATATNGGTPAYQWKSGGVNISGATNSTYTSSTLSNGEVISCEMTSSLACATGSPASSNNLTVTVNSAVAAAVSIAANPAGAICSGTTVTFTATPTNGGVASYQWKNNGSAITGATNSTFTSSTLANGDVITCVMTSGLACATGSPATSNAVTMSVSSSSTAGVIIAANPLGAVCSGTSVTFTATPSNGGSPSYQWQINGSSISGATNSTYTSSVLVDGDNITCIMISSLTCATGSPATSNTITMSVGAVGAAGVSIDALPAGTICSGTSVTFTATPTNGGSNPAYQWQVNGANISGATNATYITSTLSSGDIVTCEVTSSLTCATGSPALSNQISMTVDSSVPASVSITASPSTTICSGDTVTFLALPSNEGTNPTYQWQLNGVDVGPNASTISTSSLINGDVITCVLTSSLSCASGNPATSNNLIMAIGTTVNVGIAIYASPSGPICDGTNVTFVASPQNPGSNPTYQWQVNGNNVGTNSTTYSSSSLTDGDIVTCSLTSDLSCVTNNPAASNQITMTVGAGVNASVSISSGSPTTVCSGETVIFSATPLNGGTAPVFQWQINGIDFGSNSSVFSYDAFSDGDIVTCIMTSSMTCASGSPATSNSISVSIYPTLSAPVITQVGDTLFSNYPTNNQWYYTNILGGFAISGATANYYIPVITGDYFVIVLDSNGCLSDTSNIVSVYLGGIDEEGSSEIEIFPNPNNGIFTISYNSINGENAEINLVNSIGQTLVERRISNHSTNMFNASFLAPGLYFLKLTTGKSVQLHKVLITR